MTDNFIPITLLEEGKEEYFENNHETIISIIYIYCVSSFSIFVAAVVGIGLKQFPHATCMHTSGEIKKKSISKL